MSHDHEADINKHVRTYMMVFGALIVLTFVTVGVYYIDMPPAAAIGLALLIASIKGSLVACYFMHLISEKKLILYVLVLTVLFFFFELLLPVITETNNIDLGA